MPISFTDYCASEYFRVHRVLCQYVEVYVTKSPPSLSDHIDRLMSSFGYCIVYTNTLFATYVNLALLRLKSDMTRSCDTKIASLTDSWQPYNPAASMLEGPYVAVIQTTRRTLVHKSCSR